MNLFNGKLLFAAFDAAHGQELWSVTPGDYAGAALLKDINPGPANGNPYAFAVADPLLIFIGNDGVPRRGAVADRRDGGGTQMVKDVNPGAPDGSISWGEMASTFYTVVFFATDGIHGAEPMGDGRLGRRDGDAARRATRRYGSDPVGARYLNNKVWFKAMTESTARSPGGRTASCRF
jgi:ELWxxDGT repeat protein